MISAAYGGASFWNPEQDEPVSRLEWIGSILVINCSPDRRYLATGDQDSTVHFWNLKSGKELQMWGYPTQVRELAWDSTSRYLATGRGPDVVVWDCSGHGPRGTTPVQLKGHDQFLTALVYRLSGSLLASGAEDGRLTVWRSDKTKKAHAQADFDLGIAQITRCRPGDLLVAGTESGTVGVMRVR